MYFTRQYDRNPVSLAIFAKIVKVWVQKKFLVKQSLLKFMAQVLQFLIFLKMAFFLDLCRIFQICKRDYSHFFSNVFIFEFTVWQE